MANIAVLVPRIKMLIQAEKMAKEMGMKLHKLQVIETQDSVQAARAAIEEGANIIVARGLQSNLIQRATNIPVIELRLTGQEQGLLIARAKKIINKEKPHIAIIGFKNMYSNTDHYEELYDIKLSTYIVDEMDEIQGAVESARDNDADLIIGGDSTNDIAYSLGIPAIFNEATEESVAEALRAAKKTAYAIDVEKQAASQIDSLFETTLDGIIRLDAKQCITAVNQIVRDTLGKTETELLGRHFSNYINGIDNDFIDAILSGDQSHDSTAAQIHNTQLMATAAPIKSGNEITGCVLTLRKMAELSQNNESRLHDMYIQGFVARGNFDYIERQSKKIRKCIHLANMYSLSRSPVVIYGEVGTEKELFAQAIHNNSARRNHPYVSVNCFDSSDEKQALFLFGNDEEKGALYSANFGTLHIGNIQNLTSQCQYRLYKLITQRSLIQNDITRSMSLDVRIVASSDVDLTISVKHGDFMKELYFLLQTFTIILPPLRDSQEDIKRLADKYIDEYIKKYSKYIVLTTGGIKALKDYEWKGNLIQLKQFCELLVLTAKKRTIDEGHIKELLINTYPDVALETNTERITVYKNPEALRIIDVLERHGGSRNKAAEELGISTTTLWRKIKKFGINENFNN